jgi:hypothetical protein
MRATPEQLAEMAAQVAAAAAAGKVTVCKENESRRDLFAGYTERRMRDAENLGTSDIQSERMMLHGIL